MNRYERINFEELETLSFTGGADDEKDGGDRGATPSLVWLTKYVCDIFRSINKICVEL